MKDKIFYLLFFGLILSVYRLIPHPPNFTPVLSMAVMAPLFLKDRILSMALLIIPMFISDIFLGFHPYQFVIYTTLISITLISPMKKNFLILGSMAIASSVWFFLTTNFSVWLIWDYYPKTFEGLISCYTLAIPFFTNTIVSTVLFTGLLTFALKYLDRLNASANYILLKFANKYFNFNKI